MSNAHIKPEVKPVHDVTMRDLFGEIVYENQKSARLKAEFARLRAGIADDVYEASEKI